ncbi:9924_t:CDS:2, partial [Entrophospora sp. SA101]
LLSSRKNNKSSNDKTSEKRGFDDSQNTWEDENNVLLGQTGQFDDIILKSNKEDNKNNDWVVDNIDCMNGNKEDNSNNIDCMNGKKGNKEDNNNNIDCMIGGDNENNDNNNIGFMIEDKEGNSKNNFGFMIGDKEDNNNNPVGFMIEDNKNKDCMIKANNNDDEDLRVYLQQQQSLLLESWEDKVKNVRNVEKREGEIIVHLNWNNGRITSHTAEIVNIRCPQKIISFYEDHLRFKE